MWDGHIHDTWSHLDHSYRQSFPILVAANIFQYSTKMDTYLDASELASIDMSYDESPTYDYLTPAPSSEAGDDISVQGEPRKKKRKAW